MSIPSLLSYDHCSPKVYKLLYASRLADHGLPAQALNYCEHIATVLLGQDPASHPVLAQQLVKVSLVPLLHRSWLGTSLGSSRIWDFTWVPAHIDGITCQTGMELFRGQGCFLLWRSF